MRRLASFRIAALTICVSQWTLAGAPLAQAPQLIAPTTKGYIDPAASGRPKVLVDVDGDGDLDYFRGISLYERVDAGPLLFVDVSSARMPASLAGFVATAIIAGDIDADGDQDLIASGAIGGSAGTPQARLLLNDGFGNFSDATATRMPTDEATTNALALADFDGDGDDDLLLGNGVLTWFLQDRDRLYLNDGAGTFTDVTAIQMPQHDAWTTSFAVADVDGDGDLDFVAGRIGAAITAVPDEDIVYLNDGTARFTPSGLPLDTRITRAVEFADLDADGDPDLVALHSSSTRSISVLINDGSGRFADESDARAPGVGDGSELSIGDLDGDGDLDLVKRELTWTQRTPLLINDGTGVFTPAATSRLAAFGELFDVDGDGDLDAIAGDSIAFNDGNGQFSGSPGVLSPFSPRQRISDADDDGDLDVIDGDVVRFNRRQQLEAPDLARIGGSYRLRVHAKPGYASGTSVGVPFVGFRPARISTSFGTLWVTPSQLTALPPVTLPALGGAAETALQLPVDPTLAGLVFYCQALIVEHGGGETRLTNVIDDRFAGG